jgi:hypothetical protein
LEKVIHLLDNLRKLGFLLVMQRAAAGFGGRYPGGSAGNHFSEKKMRENARRGERKMHLRRWANKVERNLRPI